MTWYQRICPHPFGWSYNTHRRESRTTRTETITTEFGKVDPVLVVWGWKDV
jgi:hypothetical protein